MNDTDNKFKKMASQAMVEAARQLRQRETTAEKQLWECLRNRRLGRLKFRRQHPVWKTNYVADFFCYEQHLIIELDGEVHRYQYEDDVIRQEDMEAKGYRILRFSNDDIRQNLEGVLVTIARAAAQD